MTENIDIKASCSKVFIVLLKPAFLLNIGTVSRRIPLAFKSIQFENHHQLKSVMLLGDGGQYLIGRVVQLGYQ